MFLRIIRKAYKTILNYGPKELYKRTRVFFDRKFHSNKYFFTKPQGELKENAEKNVLFISGEPRNATSYYRCEIPLKQLETVGWGGQIIDEGYANEADLTRFKYIIFYRTPINDKNAKIIQYAKKNNIKIIFSIDDLVYRKDLLEKLDYTSYLDKADADRLLLRADGMIELMKSANAGIASTDYLAKDMKKYIKGSVFVNRNGIIEAEYERPSNDIYIIKTPEQKLVLGYLSGSETHDRDLAVIWPVLKKVLLTNKNIELWVGGRINFDFEEVKDKVRRLPFLPRAKFMRLLEEIDINLLPLEDTEFNQGKSEVKYIEAALVKVPTIASSIGDFPNILKQKQTAMLASSENEWKKSLGILIEDGSIRQEIALNANQNVLQNYSLRKLGDKLTEFLSSL